MDARRKRWLVATLLIAALLAGTGIGRPAAAQVVVGVIDLDGKDGGGVAANPNTHRVYVAVAGQIRVYDAQTRALVTTIALPQNYTACYDLAVNPATNRIYAVGFRIYVIDGNTQTVLQHWDKSGREVAVNPATNRVYVAGMVSYPYTDPYTVHVLNGANNTWLPDMPLGSTGAFEYIHLAVNSNANRVYIAFTGDDDLRVLDGVTHAEVARPHLPDIGSVAVNPASNRVYVCTSYAGAVVLDGTSHAQVGTVPKIAGRLRLNPLTGRLYGVALRLPGYILQVADSVTNQVIDNVYLDGDLENYALDDSLGRIFGTHDSYPAAWAKRMTVIQDASPAGPAPTPVPDVIATLDLPAVGHGIAVNTATNRVYTAVDGGVAVFDATTLAPLPFIPLLVGGYPASIYDVGVDTNLNRIYAVGISWTYAIDGATNQVLDTLGGGEEIAVNPSNGRVYIAYPSPFRNVPDYLRIYDGVTLSHVRTLELGTTTYTGNWVHVAVNPATNYAYCTYSKDNDLRIISPATDQVVQIIDYPSAGTIAVNPSTNRVYVWVSRDGQSGALALDGNTHAELGMIQGVGAQLEVNPETNHLYGYGNRTLFQVVDGASGEPLGRVFLDGDIEHYAVYPGLRRLYASHSSVPADWGRHLSVIQDAGGPALPTPTPTCTPTPTPTPVWTDWLHLPRAER